MIQIRMGGYANDDKQLLAEALEVAIKYVTDAGRGCLGAQCGGCENCPKYRVCVDLASAYGWVVMRSERG